MTHLVRTELFKLATTRSPWLLAAAAVGLTAALALQPVLRAGRGGVPSIGTVGATLGVLDAMGRGALVALLLGVAVTTTDARHRTISVRVLQTPERWRLATGQALTAVLVGLVVGVTCLAAVLAVGVASGALQRGTVNADIAVRGGGLLLAYPLYALAGAGVGTLLGRNQALAGILPVAWLLGLEALLVSRLPQEVRLWSLNGVTAAAQHAGDLPGVLPVWLGAGALLAYTLALAVVGATRLHRADLT